MIKKIQLKNYQRHSDLTLDFNKDINVITGLTNAGKTCIFRAIEWVYNCSDISEKDYRKEGTKQTSVKIWLDNDYQLERIKSNSINRYILSQDGHDDMIFDSFGKNIPDEIADVLDVLPIDVEDKHINLNFANQDQLNFLIDNTYSDTFKAKLFNKLTGNEVLDKLFKELNKESLRISKELKSNDKLLEEHEIKIEEFSNLHKHLQTKLIDVEERYISLKDDIEIYTILKELSDKLKSNKEQAEFVEYKKKQIKVFSEDIIDDLKTHAEVYNKLLSINKKLSTINASINNTINSRKCVKEHDVDISNLVEENNRLQKLIKFQTLLNDNINNIVKTDNDKKIIVDKLSIAEEQLKNIWKECKVCPLCGKEQHE